MHYTVIIPAFNEEQYLPATLEALAVAMESLEYTGQVVVVDNNSSDDTAGRYCSSLKAGMMTV